jgi:uncharacterized protein YaaQ
MFPGSPTSTKVRCTSETEQIHENLLKNREGPQTFQSHQTDYNQGKAYLQTSLVQSQQEDKVEPTIDRLAVTIVDGSQSRNLIQVLNTHGFRVTLVNAVGGFLHDSLVTLFVGTETQRLPELFALLREHCPRRSRYVPMGVEMAMAPGHPAMIEVHVGGASVFVLPVEQFLQL